MVKVIGVMFSAPASKSFTSIVNGAILPLALRRLDSVALGDQFLLELGDVRDTSGFRERPPDACSPLFWHALIGVCIPTSTAFWMAWGSRAVVEWGTLSVPYLLGIGVVVEL